MVLQKRLEYGFNGYQAPATPRALRSTRRRAKFQRRVEDNHMGAFDLLATVAGELLQEKGDTTICSDTSSEKDQHVFVKECQDANKSFEVQLSDEGSKDKECYSLLSSWINNQNCSLNEFPQLEVDGHSGIASMVTSSSYPERFIAEKLVAGKNHNEMENDTSKVKLDSSGYPEDCRFQLDGVASEVNDELHKFEKGPIGNGSKTCSLENLPDENRPALISLGGNAKFSGYSDRIPSVSLSNGCDNVPVVSRDDDENPSWFTHPCKKIKSFRPKTCESNNRIGKILASKFRKVVEQSKEDILSSSDGDLKRTYCLKKTCYKRQSSQMNIPFKKRKLFNCSSVANSNGFISSGSVYYSPENGVNQDASGSSPRMHQDAGISSLDACQDQKLQCRSSHVNLRIESFTVPELFIEVPENATVRSLKRTVMDAMTAVLGDGLRIGVILQGKKVRDDSKTLLQTGISHDNQLDALGFTLEPNSSQSLPIVCAAHSPLVPNADIPQPLIRYPSIPAVIHPQIQGSSGILPEHQTTSLDNPIESDNDSAPLTVNESVDKGRPDSKELFSIPEMDKEELAMVTVPQKSKQSEIAQRRIRRPFSVDEVEALVQAVEKLGTGRWRDVKLLAFENAKHRTYVDLKDKWKTLVHTARISPQQRRGEPVPQELLHRVLNAHAYWSQQQTKQQHKQHTETAFFNKALLPTHGFVDGVGVLVSDFCY